MHGLFFNSGLVSLFSNPIMFVTDLCFYSMQRAALLTNAVMTITQLAKECEKISRIT